ncbi:MAG: response regulator transcription factor [Verrucomicrobia bacterium]|nr:response regulator transcription factor [Verrucomicrobiota bacterium]
MIRVAIVEDHAGQRKTLADLLNTAGGFCCVGAVGSAEEALALLPELKPEVVLMDLHLPGKDGIHAVRRLRLMLPATQFLMLTVEDDSEFIFEALQAGATGYLLKRYPPDKILTAIEDAHSGGAPMSAQVARIVVQSFRTSARAADSLAKLTPRELEVLQALSKGYRYKEIADQLGIAQGTVEGYIKSIYTKLQVHSAVEAAEILRGNASNVKSGDQRH